MPNKILIIRFSSIGDIVLTTPVIRALNQSNNYEIHFVVKKKFESVLQFNPYITKIHSFDRDIDEIIENLKKESFDTILDLHNNLRSNRLVIRLKAKAYKVNKLNVRKWLLVNFKWDIMPKKHIVERYFEAISYPEVKYDGKGLDYFNGGISNAELLKLLPTEFQNGYTAIAVGGAHFTKQIPTEKIALLVQKSASPVILLGGKEDRKKATQIEEKFGKKVFNACGLFSLHQSAAAIEFSEKVITADTGLMHIAAAYKKEIHSFWGSTVTEFGMTPFLPENLKNLSIIHQVENLTCRPCSKIGFDKCPKKHFDCMNKIQY